MVPTGPRAAPLYAVAAPIDSALPCIVGAAVGALLTRRSRKATP